MKRLVWRAALIGFVLMHETALAQTDPVPRKIPVELPSNSVDLPGESSKPLPINLAVAMQLAGSRPIDVNVAARQVEIAAALYDRSRVLWVPSLNFGTDYLRHDGTFQTFQGDVQKSNRGSLMVGVGPNVVFGVSDAIFSPLAAHQDLRARQAIRQAINNDTALAVAEAYFTVQQARGELAIALQIIKDAELLRDRTQRLAEGLAPELEATRARVELGKRRQTAASALERWRLAGSELTRILRLDPGAMVEPVEPANLTIQLIDTRFSLDDLIVIGLTSRPELSANQALVKATLQRLRQEKLRPLVPSLLLRSVSTNPSGSLATGAFGGGSGGTLSNFGGRFDYDVQVIWELQNFGLGNKASMDQRRAEHEVAILESFRVQDRVAAEVTQAFAQVRSATDRLAEAEPALRDARESLTKNLEGITQTRRLGNVLILIVRPAEVVAAIQAMGQANADYFAAVADYNRAQFRLYRALGHPSQCLAETKVLPEIRGQKPELRQPAARLLPPQAVKE